MSGHIPPREDIRTATFVVAANDSLHKNMADYVCDGVADDVEINAALAALPAAGGKVLLLEGNYTTIANITAPANATLEGQGKATIITPTGAAITNGIVLNGDNITLKDMKVILAAGAGTAPGFRPNVVYATGRTLLWLENLWLVGDNTVLDDGSLVRQNGVCFVTCTYCKVVNCESQTNKRNGILIRTNSNNNTVMGNTCQGNTAKGIYIVTTSNYNTVTGNTCQGNTEDGINLLTNCNNNTIAGNTCQGNTAYGIFVDHCSNNTFVGNTCQGNTCCGIIVSVSPQNTITGNTCSYNDTGGATYSGIYVGASSHRCVITGNLCEHNGLHGIYIFRSDSCTVTGNGCHYQNTGDGINVTGDGTRNADYNSLTGNICTSNADDGIAIEGVGDANKNIVVANQLLGNGGTPLVDNGTLTEVGHNITV